jgi:ribonuclease HII
MSNSDYECVQIIDDSDDECIDKNNQEKEYIIIKNKPKRVIKPQPILKKFHIESPSVYEIGVDEAGRGPLFGRVYTAAVILPKDNTFDHSKMKDSKKFHSKKKIEEVAEYIKEHALAWYVSFEDEKTIDEINILQATQQSMRNAILELRKQFNKKQKENGTEEKKDYTYHLLIDGNYFTPITILNKKTNKIEAIPYITIEGGDNKYSAIAAASILAKTERDKYIEQLCKENPTLSEYYAIDTNMGYGAKKHLDGIKEHGITIWHRRSFGICKQYV